jgi:hypothetical protein
MLRVGVAQASSNETIRRWNPDGASIRDRVASGFDIPIRNTFHIMDLARQGRLPDKIMINAHPQRWENRALPWVRELVWQNVKNVVKKGLRDLIFFGVIGSGCGKFGGRF